MDLSHFHTGPLRTGVPELDLQHEALWVAAGRIQKMVLLRVDVGDLRRELHLFTSSLKGHFAHEEALAQAGRFHVSPDHRDDHHRIASLMHAMEETLRTQQGMPMAMPMFDALDLIEQHIVRFDLEFRHMNRL
jgi:hemerythrin-like metal-binding protein